MSGGWGPPVPGRQPPTVPLRPPPRCPLAPRRRGHAVPAQCWSVAPDGLWSWPWLLLLGRARAVPSGVSLTAQERATGLLTLHLTRQPSPTPDPSAYFAFMV